MFYYIICMFNITGSSEPRLGISVQMWVWVPARADLRHTNWCSHVYWCDSHVRLASMLVSSLKFTARKGNKAQGDMVTKKWHWIWFSQNNEEIPAPTPRTMFESQPGLGTASVLNVPFFSVLFCSFKERNIIFRFFLSFWWLMKPKSTMRSFLFFS